MAGGIGLLLGAGLGIASRYSRQQAQEKAQSDLTWHEFSQNMVSKMGSKELNTPEGQKMVKSLLGEHADAGMMMLNARAQAREQFATQLGQVGGSTGAVPPGAGGTPANAPGMMMPQQGAPGPSFGPSQQAQPQQAPTDSHDQFLAELNQRMSGLTAMEGQATDPDQIAQIKSVKEDIKGRIAQVEEDKKGLEHHQEHQDTLASQKEGRAQREADFQQSQASAAESRNTTHALMQQGQDERKQMDNFQKQRINEADTDKRAALDATQAKNIDSNRDKLLADWEKLKEPDRLAAGSAMGARVKGHNAMASQFYRKHADAGAPTLLKFTPGKASGGYRIAGGTGEEPVSSTIEVVPPEYGTNKKTGQIGWKDADGNFYPESGSSATANVGS
jgi:hypothetical protein